MKKHYRCAWSEGKPLYECYHDTEWGVPLFEDNALFELLMLEGMQAGLTWWCVLQKRDHYRKLFANFDPVKIARFSDDKLEKYLTDPGIIRNRLKVYGIRQNAKALLRLQKTHGSFSDWLWQFVEGTPIQNTWKTLSEVPAKTVLSDKLSRELKKTGFTFVGSTICYAFMQASGMINDHLSDCFRHVACKKMAKKS